MNTQSVTLRMIALAALGAACGDEWFLNADKGGGTDLDGSDTDTDADSDTDADTDADTDSDTDADTDTDTGTDALDCEADWVGLTPAPGSAGLGTCVVDELFCGDVILGTTTGGSTIYDYDFWESEGALGSLILDFTALDGPERSYVFRGLQQGQNVTVTVDACMDVWANWIRYGDANGDFCTLDNFGTGGLFDTSTGARNRSQTFINPASPSGYDFEIIVEGLHSVGGNYVITVECGS